MLDQLYGHSLALLTDLYQLTMAYGYWKSGRAELEAAFHLFFRRLPFGGGYAVAAGLGPAVEWLERFRFEASDLEYLAGLRGNDGRPLFEPAFLEYLAGLRLTCSIDALPEGTLVFPHEPLVRVVGPILECQLLETALLTLINLPTLIATKAARVCHAAAGQTVVEFGLRRAQGIDGGMSASRAAMIGGCAATSNVLAGKLLGVPVKGTHAHSWVMCFEAERESFETYAHAMPNNCIFLVDTYETRQGVRHAIETARELRARGHEMVGIRLDSGDFLGLSLDARRMLDEAGFPKAIILASGDLDEYQIESLNREGARIDVWGVGTRLVTAFDEPALGGVYKLSAVRSGGKAWRHRIKLSDDPAKGTNPGIQQVRRFFDDDRMLADVIYSEDAPPNGDCNSVDVADPHARRTLAAGTPYVDLLVPVLRDGERVAEMPSLDEIRARAERELSRLPPESKRLEDPAAYPVGLEASLTRLKRQLADEARSVEND